MIKFFRRIRQKLIMQNKTSKYLKYAIGEIVLVVIGILIALSINNWNTNRLNQKKEISILYELKAEYENKLNELNQKVELRNFMIGSTSKLISLINENNYTITHDTLVSLAAMTVITPTFDASNSVTNELLNTGNLYILQNKELRRQLLDWSSQLDKLVEEERLVVKIIVENYLPYLNKRVPYQDISRYFLKENTEVLQFIMKNTKDTDQVLTTSNRQTDIRSLFQDLEFESYMATINFSCIISNMQSENLRIHISNVMNLLDTELKMKIN